MYITIQINYIPHILISRSTTNALVETIFIPEGHTNNPI